MIGIASAVAVVVAVVVGVAVTTDSGTAGSHSRPGLPIQLGSMPESDEDQIRVNLSAIQDAWNGSDYAAFVSHVCAKIRNKQTSTESVFTEQRNEIGEITFAIDSVTVSTAAAKVAVTETLSNQGTVSETLKFVKEVDQWKLC
jgi:hypothetical protein